MVVAVPGFIVMLVLNAFFLDDYDAYGEVPIPGSGSVHLPRGEVTVNFHTVTRQWGRWFAGAAARDHLHPA